jgi:filamentous hemagglutinin
MKGSDLSAGDHLTVLGSNINIDAGTDEQQSAETQRVSQYGVTLTLGGVVGDTAASVNRGTAAAHEAHDPRLAALDVAQAGLTAYGAKAASSGQASALAKVTVSVGGGSSHGEAQSSSVLNEGSTLAGQNVVLVATGSGAKDGSAAAADGDINARGAKIIGENVTLDAARDVNLLSAQGRYEQSSNIVGHRPHADSTVAKLAEPSPATDVVSRSSFR